MKKELQDKLYLEFPKLFKQKGLSMRETCMCWGIETGDGWFQLIKDTCTKLQFQIDNKIIPQIEFTQVKEKFGGLRIYFTPYNEKAQKILDKAENYSFKICEICGSTEGVTQNKRGWILTLCSECRKRKQK